MPLKPSVAARMQKPWELFLNKVKRHKNEQRAPHSTDLSRPQSVQPHDRRPLEPTQSKACSAAYSAYDAQFKAWMALCTAALDIRHKYQQARPENALTKPNQAREIAISQIEAQVENTRAFYMPEWRPEQSESAHIAEINQEIEEINHAHNVLLGVFIHQFKKISGEYAQSWLPTMFCSVQNSRLSGLLGETISQFDDNARKAAQSAYQASQQSHPVHTSVSPSPTSEASV